MELFTRKERAAWAVTEWLSRGPSETRAKVEALGSNPTPDAIDAAIGNPTWTWMWCDECKNQVDVAVQLGDTPDYNSSTATICATCLADAVALAGEQP